MKTVDATKLKVGDRIKWDGAERVATVTELPERQAHNTIQIHTNKGSALTTLPCPVDIID